MLPSSRDDKPIKGDRNKYSAYFLINIKMFMKCHYQLFPFIFFKFNLEQVCFPKIQNLKKTKCMLKYYIETKNYCSKKKYSETSFLIQKQITGKHTGCSVSKANTYHWARKVCWLKMLPTIMLCILNFCTPCTK